MNRVWDKFPLASAGLPYLGGCLVLALVASALGVWWMAIPLWVIMVWMVWFFRDPARQSQATEKQVISPADGKVVAVQEVDCPQLPQGRARLVSIFMNIFDVHVNRAPVGGQVKALGYHPGGFVPADRPGARLGNEQMSMVLATPQGGRLMVNQVAGLVARRIECWAAPGQNLERGERYGMIRFGSRLDVYLPLTASVLVRPGQRVKAGVTPIGEM